MSTDTRLLHIRGLRCGYGAAPPVLDGVNLDVPPGAIYALLGPSGCGKTTLVHAAAGFLQPQGGTVRFRGQEVRGPSPERVVLFQEFSLFPWASAQRNVEFALKCLGVPAKDRAAAAGGALDMVGLGEFRGRLPGELSGGMQRRVALARALVVRPRLLLADEALTGLDYLLRQQLQELIRGLCRELGITVLWVTHDLDEAAYMSERIFVMRGRPGRISRVVDVALDPDRPAGLRRSPEFLHVLANLRQEMAPE